MTACPIKAKFRWSLLGKRGGGGCVNEPSEVYNDTDIVHESAKCEHIIELNKVYNGTEMVYECEQITEHSEAYNDTEVVHESAACERVTESCKVYYDTESVRDIVACELNPEYDDDLKGAQNFSKSAEFEHSALLAEHIKEKNKYHMTLDEKSNLQIPSNLLQRFGTAAVCIVLLIFISGLYDFTLHLQIRKYDGLTYCGRIAKIITTAF